MVYEKEVFCGQITLNNSKFKTNLAYSSSRSYIYIEKSTRRNEAVRRLDFAIPEAMSIITLLIETSNTGEAAEYIYPSGKVKFVSRASSDSTIVRKYEFKNNSWVPHDNSMKIYLTEMPAVISLIHRALTAFPLINWQNVEPISPPQTHNADAQAILKEMFPNRYK